VIWEQWAQSGLWTWDAWVFLSFATSPGEFETRWYHADENRSFATPIDESETPWHQTFHTTSGPSRVVSAFLRMYLLYYNAFLPGSEPLFLKTCHIIPSPHPPQPTHICVSHIYIPRT